MKKFTLGLGVASLFALFAFSPVAHATITEFEIYPASGSETAGYSNAEYEISFIESSDIKNRFIKVTFPSGYSIENGSLWAYSNVLPIVEATGNSSERSITLTLEADYQYDGSPHSFRLEGGITNPGTPSTIGAGQFLISTLPSGGSKTNTNSFSITNDRELIF